MNPRAELTPAEERKVRNIEDQPGLEAARRRRRAFARAVNSEREMSIDAEMRHERVRQ